MRRQRPGRRSDFCPSAPSLPKIARAAPTPRFASANHTLHTKALKLVSGDDSMPTDKTSARFKNRQNGGRLKCGLHLKSTLPYGA